MGVKEVKFELKLYVANKEIASSEDLRLWQMVFAKISNTSETGNETGLPASIDDSLSNFGASSTNLALDEFSKELGVDIDIVKGACDPVPEEPFMHLDMHFWSEWTKNTSKRGRDAISAVILSATLLALWFRNTKLGSLSLKEIRKVLANLGIEQKNLTRSINKCEWLQLRQGKTIQINPAEIKKAIEVARAFCEKRMPNLKEIN